MTTHHTKTKGDLGLIKTILDLTEKGYEVFTPLSEHTRADLVAIDQDGYCYRIQVKYSSNNYLANKSIWADKNGNHVTFYKENDFDYYALYIPQIDKVLYPSIKYGGATIVTTIPMSGFSFYWWEDFINFTDNAEKRSLKDFPEKESEFKLKCSEKFKQIYKRLGPEEIQRRRKVIRPSKEELFKLVWEKPTTLIAKDFGVSDKAIEKWVRSYDLEKPPRGYWAKLAAKN